MGFGNRVAAARASAPKNRFSLQPVAGRNNNHLITDEEIDQYSKRRQHNGDEKDEPDDASGATKNSSDDQKKGLEPLIDPIAEKYYTMLNVDVNSAWRSSEYDESDHARHRDEERERRRERHRLKKAAKAAYEGHLKDKTALMHCGRSCEARHQQMQLAYHVINSKLDRDLYDVLEVKNVEVLDRTALKKKYADAREKLQKKKAALQEAGEEYTEEDEEIELEEISDALEILSNNEARAYYNLYGEKPPEAMKHLSAKHGGWGQEMAFARNIHMKIILSILKYLDSWWADMGIIALVVFFIGITVWLKLPELMELAEMIEAHDARMKEIEAKQS